jgi:organic hydroperoxide reductase OsmC/OhrA
MRVVAMTSQKIAAAMQRVESVLRRRPDVGLHEDAPATARWERGTRVVSSHANGAQLVTDMPTELGGGGDQVTPGWLFRAGLASCFATRIAMGAAAAGIELTKLEVLASSRSDTRGLFGMADVSGEPVGAGPRDVQLLVKIAASGVSAERLRTLVEDSNRCSPISAAVRESVSVALRIEVDTV